MALIKCPECGNQISEKAPKCPHCGCNMVDALRNKAKIEEEIKAKEKVSSLVVEQDKIIEHLESSAKEEIQSLIEAQERTISKLETAMSKGYKNKRPNSGKYIFWGILCCSLIIGGYYLFKNDGKEKFDSNNEIIENSIEPTTESKENLKSTLNPNESMELKAMRNYSSYEKALATTGVVWDGNYQNDSIRIFVRAVNSVLNEDGRYELSTFEGYFYSIKDPQNIYTCKFDSFSDYVEELGGRADISFQAYDKNERFIGYFDIYIEPNDYCSRDNETEWDDYDGIDLLIWTNVHHEAIKNSKRILIK